jgi:hypothetical protein
MGANPVDLNIHRALVQAVAECIMMRAPEQIPFIADFLEKLSTMSPPFEQKNPIHEDCTNFSNEPIMDLYNALERTYSSRESYIRRVMTVLKRFFPSDQIVDSSNPNIVHYRVHSGSSELDIPVNVSETRQEITNLVRIILFHLNHL